MKNIITILSELGISVPEDKTTALNKAVAENYKTIEEHNNKLTAANNRAKVAEDALKEFEGIDAKDLQKQVEEANKKVKEAQEAAEKQLAERDFNDALKTALDGIQFTSTAARKAIEADVRANCSKVKDGTIIGFTDVIEAARKADASAFVDVEQQELEKNRPRFTQPNGGGGNPGGTVTLKDIMKIKDATERQRQIEQHKHLFRKGE